MARSWPFLSGRSEATAAFGFGRDRNKQCVKLGIVQVLQRSRQVLRQAIARMRSSIIPVGVPG